MADSDNAEHLLSDLAVPTLYQCDSYPHPDLPGPNKPLRVQVIQRHKTKGDSQIYYGLTLSDGTYFLYILLTPALNHLVSDGMFVKYAVIALHSFVINRAVLQDGKQYRWFESLDVEVVSAAHAYVISIPVPYEDTIGLPFSAQSQEGGASLLEKCEKQYGQEVTQTMQELRDTIDEWNRFFIEHGKLPRAFEDDGTNAFLEFKRLFVECTPFFMELSKALEGNSHDANIHKFLEHCTTISQNAAKGLGRDSARKAEVLGYLRAVREHIITTAQSHLKKEGAEANLVFVEDPDPVSVEATKRMLDGWMSRAGGASELEAVQCEPGAVEEISLTLHAVSRDIVDIVASSSLEAPRVEDVLIVVQVLQIIDTNEESDMDPLYLLVISDGHESTVTLLAEPLNYVVEEVKLHEGCIIEITAIEVRRDREREIPWFECDECRKWRKLKETEADLIGEDFVCSMNSDKTYSSCDAPAEMTRQELEALSNQVDQLMMEQAPTVVTVGLRRVLSPGTDDVIGSPTDCEELIEAEVDKWKDRSYDVPEIVFQRPVTYASTVPPPSSHGRAHSHGHTHDEGGEAECTWCGPLLVTIRMKISTKKGPLVKDFEYSTEPKWKLGRLFASHGKANNVSASSIHYHFRGQRIHAYQTAEQVGLDHGDIVVAQLVGDSPLTEQSAEDKEKLEAEVLQRQERFLAELEEEENRKEAKRKRTRAKKKKKKKKAQRKAQQKTDDDAPVREEAADERSHDDDDDDGGTQRNKQGGHSTPQTHSSTHANTSGTQTNAPDSTQQTRTDHTTNTSKGTSAGTTHAAKASNHNNNPNTGAKTNTTTDTGNNTRATNNTATSNTTSNSTRAAVTGDAHLNGTGAGSAPPVGQEPALNGQASTQRKSRSRARAGACGPATASAGEGGEEGAAVVELRCRLEAAEDDLAKMTQERARLEEEVETRIVLGESMEAYRKAVEKANVALRGELAALQNAAGQWGLGPCVVCGTSARVVVTLPCKHLMCCAECAASQDTCFCCNAEVEDSVVLRTVP